MEVVFFLLGMGVGASMYAAYRKMQADAPKALLDRQESLRKSYESNCPLPEGKIRFTAEGGFYYAVQSAEEV